MNGSTNSSNFSTDDSYMYFASKKKTSQFREAEISDDGYRRQSNRMSALSKRDGSDLGLGRSDRKILYVTSMCKVVVLVIIAFVFINIVMKHKDIDLGNAKHLTGSAKYDVHFGKSTSIAIVDDATHLSERREDKTLFTFEVARHGARAPLVSELNGVRVIDGFSVTEGMLTPQGVRQRYLLGRYNREFQNRDTRNYCLCGTSQEKQGIYVESSDWYRTL